MKRIYTCLLFLFFLFIGKGFSQDCIVLGCAANYGSQTTDGTLADQPFPFSSGCWLPSDNYKQIFWQFFKSTGGNYTQTFTPTSGGDPMNINWDIFNLNATPATTTVSCATIAANVGTNWSEIFCSSQFNPGLPAGPGVGTDFAPTGVPTTAGDYYAIAVIVYQGVSNGGDASYSFTIGTPQLDGVDLTSATCDVILPVKLSSFGAKVNNCIVNLNWEAKNESDLKKYEVESSADGRSFQTIATVGATNTGLDQLYSYQHKNPQQGKIYYRLKMTDVDGKFEYSKIIAMKFDCIRSLIFVYPNPVTDILNINITNSQGNETIASLFDHNGKLIYKGKMISGTNTIDMAKFAKGIYLLTLKNNTETQNIKIIK
jgi:Secretion system C-terminal sorting domain